MQTPRNLRSGFIHLLWNNFSSAGISLTFFFINYLILDVIRRGKIGWSFKLLVFLAFSAFAFVFVW